MEHTANKDTERDYVSVFGGDSSHNFASSAAYLSEAKRSQESVVATTSEISPGDMTTLNPVLSDVSQGGGIEEIKANTEIIAGAVRVDIASPQAPGVAETVNEVVGHVSGGASLCKEMKVPSSFNPSLATSDSQNNSPQEIFDALQQIQQNILCLIDADEERKIRMTQLPGKYHSSFSGPIMYKQLGFKKLKDLISTLPFISMPDAQAGFEYVCRAKHCNTNTQSLQQQDQSVIGPHDHVCHENELSIIEQRIAVLVSQEAEKQILLSKLPAKYQSLFSAPIPYKELGYGKLKDLINTFSLMSTPEAKPGFEYVCCTENAKDEGELFKEGESDSVPGLAIEKKSSEVSNVMNSELQFEEQIHILIDSSPNQRIALSEFPERFLSMFSYKFDHIELNAALAAIPSVAICGDDEAHNYVCRAHKNQQITNAISTGMPEVCDLPLENSSTGKDGESLVGDAEQTDGPPSLSFSVAENLKSSKLHKKILDFLSRNPAGVNCSQVLRAVKGLIYYIKDQSTEAGKEHMLSPADVLRHCEGIESKNIDGRNLFFLATGFCSGVIQAKSNVDSSIVTTGTGDTEANGVTQGNESTRKDSTSLLVHEDAQSDYVASLVRTVADGLASTQLHQKILDLLSRNPEGVTCSQILKEVEGLPVFLKSQASEAGEDFVSPAAVLRHCEGIQSKQIDERNLFYLDGVDLSVDIQTNDLGNSSTALIGPSIRTSDSVAALEFLVLLQEDFHGRPWPASKKQLKQFLSGIDTSTAPGLINWIEVATSNDFTAAKKKKEALKRLMFQLKKMGCLGGNNKSLAWDLSIAQQLIDEQKVHRPGASPRLSDFSPAGRGEITNKMTTGENVPVKLIDTVEQLENVKLLVPFSSHRNIVAGADAVVAVDCEGVPSNLFLVQVATVVATYVFDCVKLGAAEVCEALAPLLMDSNITKLFHDLHNDAVAFANVGGVQPLRGTIDTQLAVELLTGELHAGFNQMLQQFGQDKHPLKSGMKQTIDGGTLFARRPLPPDVLNYAALDVILLLGIKEMLFDALGSACNKVQQASDKRALISPQTGGARQICFDVANTHSMASSELLKEVRPDDMLVPVPLTVSDDTSVLLDMLPEDLRSTLMNHTSFLSDIALDKGRAPLAWVSGDRLFLGEENRAVTANDINGIVERLGGFGSDNRAGLERQLHRISAVRNRQSEIIGLTMRVGRHITGNATIMSDLLLGDCTKSILFMGEPGSGKTTVVREVTRLLAEQFNVWVVDTSNEIAGDGDIPHPCVGLARRMMVPNLDKQSEVLIECVQNHTPDVMVIDEIGRPTEVEAARTCKQRGVRLIASAHGDLRKLVKNPKLRGLIGGVETVTLGDAQARVESQKLGKSKGAVQKLKAQRAGSPTFDIIVELRRGAHHECRVVLDTGDAVDKILEGQHYRAQRRTRDPQTGDLTLHLESA